MIRPLVDCSNWVIHRNSKTIDLQTLGVHLVHLVKSSIVLYLGSKLDQL